jgi:hypothetical protein
MDRSRHTWIRCGRVVLALGVLTPSLHGIAQAQQPAATQDSLNVEIDALRARMDSLAAQLQTLRRGPPAGQPAPAQPPQDDLAALRAAAAAAAGLNPADTVETAPEDQQFESRQRSLQALNPEISMTGDLFGQIDSETPGQGNFFPREFELSLVSTLDPYSRAKVFVSYHEPGGEIDPFPVEGAGPEEAGVDVEEGYAQWVGLPGNLSLTVGKFRQRFGTFNRWHSHALFFQSLPLPLQVFAGEEGIAQTGASLYWLVPAAPLGGTYEVWLEPTVTSNDVLFGDSRKLSVLGHLNAFWDVSPSTYFELGVSGITGRHEGDAGGFRQNLLGVETAVDWRPPARSLYRELLFRGGIMILDPGTGQLNSDARKHAVGAWSMFDYLFKQNWHIGGRFDWAQNPEDRSQSAWLAGPTLTWWQSEFVRLRAEYDALGGPDETTGKLLLQVTFAMGPHKHETY